MERNLAAQQAILDDRLLRLETNRLFTVWKALTANSQGILRGAKSALARSPLRGLVRKPSLAQDKAFRTEYVNWLTAEQAHMPSPEQALLIAETWNSQPAISVVLSIRHGRGLTETLQSIQKQVYRNWELCLAFDENSKAQVLPLLNDFEARAMCVRYITTSGLDEPATLNAAAGLAQGEFLSFLDETGVLSPFALYSLAEAVHSATPDLLYTDEDTLDTDGRHSRPIFKPDWSPDLLTSCMYMGGFLTVRREAFQQCGGLRAEYDGAHLYDLVLRLTDEPIRVYHVPRILYHDDVVRRDVADPARASSESRAMARAIQDAIARRESVPSECIPGAGHATFFVRRNIPRGETTAVICSKSPDLLGKCLASLRETTDQAVKHTIVIAHEESGPNPHLRRVIQEAGATAIPFAGAFNFSAMNNLAADLADTSNLLFLNDDVKATSPGWADMLVEQLARQEVGIAGAVLWYPSRTLQHAGVVVGIGGVVGHAGRHAPSTELWPWLLMTRNVSAVTGACLAIRKDLFQQLGGFDTAFPNNYNDIDLCFRVRARGLAVVCVPVPGLFHRECRSRRGIVWFEERYGFYKRWGDLLSQPDPYYSPSLAPVEELALNSNHDRLHSAFLAPPA